MEGTVLVGSSDTRFNTQAKSGCETGYRCFGARYYDARIGRFSEHDPFACVFDRVSEDPTRHRPPSVTEGIIVEVAVNRRTRQIARVLPKWSFKYE